MSEVTIIAKLCMKSSGSDCHNVDLTISEAELKKIQLMEYQKEGHELTLNHAQLWGTAFSSVLFFYFFSLGIGHVLGFLKNA